MNHQRCERIKPTSLVFQENTATRDAIDAVHSSIDTASESSSEFCRAWAILNPVELLSAC